VKNEYKNARDDKREKFTLLNFKALAKCLAASSPKLVLLRSSVISACIERERYGNERHEEEKDLLCYSVNHQPDIQTRHFQTNCIQD
jgi:hypothetical protein